MFLYRNILKESFLMSWRNRFLWFFGFFATLLSGFEGYEILLNKSGMESFNLLKTWNKLEAIGIFTSYFWGNFFIFIKNDPVTFIILIIITLIFVALIGFIVWLSIVSQVGIVYNTVRLEEKKEANIQIGVERGAKSFWPVLGFNLIIKALIYLLLTILGIIFLKLQTNMATWIGYDLLYLFIFIIIIPVILIISFIIKYAICYVVIDKKNFIESFQDAIKLFLKNWLVSIEMAILLFIIGLVYGAFIISILSIIAVPILFLINITINLFTSVSFYIMVGGTIFMSVLISIAIAFIVSFQTSSWTLFFLKMNSRQGIISKLLRTTSKF